MDSPVENREATVVNWSNAALKMTMGAGSLAAVAVLADPLGPVIGTWGTVGLVVLPFAIVAMVKPGEEIPARYVKALHG
ncbi:MAG: hypothetical protein RLZ98_3752, partial [Pseudomonadota bacterium]